MEEEYIQEIQEIVKKGKAFVFSPFSVTSVDDLVEFETKYNDFSSELGCQIGDEWYDFNEGGLTWLCKSPFGHNAGRTDVFHNTLAGFGLNEVEIIIIRSFLQNVSGMYRMDAYPYGIPPFAEELNRWLQSALSKLPCVGDCVVVRQCRYNKLDFEEGDIFEPVYSLTTSANKEWNDGYGDQYVITTLSTGVSKARSLIYANDHEQQVTFLLGAKFRVDRINEKEDGTKTFFMSEIE